MDQATNVLRLSSERLYARELEALAAVDQGAKPPGWRLSPRAALTFITGGEAGGVPIRPKYIGNKRLVEMAIATLLTDRALLLIGEPGTAKSWLSENLTAAIHGDSSKVIQGTAGTSEEHIRYSWNYALLLAQGPSDQALIKSPIYRAMEEGGIARFEEISRCASEVQDALISILSEKTISIPELGRELSAAKGFSVIATANTRDRGVNEMSAALKRRFNIIVLPAPASIDTEVDIVNRRVAEIASSYELQAALPDEEAVRKVVTIFRELRGGATLDNKEKVKPPSGVISTAEAISLLTGSMALAASFGTGEIADEDIAACLQGAIVKDEEKDRLVWKEYLDNVMKKRGSEWRSLYNACKELNG
ncbi:ATPase [Cohnella sp. CIP 111063]|uniref:ATP-binding protein n=1 Tax=unclassified Cohnella TaxID=2636738 RepID=UPI000B8C3C72|nr:MULTISPECIES: AAA family ATPase [unclassified Cohnella]OXS55233.1 ATPase [Cohnella sp. CIP 111063]PRX65656.1 dynein-related subfamily AAA family protein [Cohnella sp. SGD-V74]